MENEQVEQTEQVEQQEQVQQEQVEQKETREDRRAQHDFLRFKQEAKKAQEENLKLLDRIKQMEESSLSEKQNWKELYERKAKEVEQYKGEIDQRDKVFFNSLKNQEVEKEALKLGIRPEALEDIRRMDQSGIVTETTSTGHINVIGATEFVEQLKQTRPFWFKTQGAPNVNTNNPNATFGKKLTASEILKLEKSDPKKYQEEMLKLIKK